MGDGHELVVAELTWLDRRRPAFAAHCSCGHWHATGYLCHACLEFDHARHVDGDLPLPDDAA